jgi:hypothetical protein
MNQLHAQLDQNAAIRLNKIKPIDNSTALCTVDSYDIKTGNYKGIAADGSVKYFRYIGNASLAIGSQISVITPSGALIGWGDTKAR